MTRDEAIQRAEVAMAWARGEEVQFIISDGSWLTAPNLGTANYRGPDVFNPMDKWRIKPKPLECWVKVGNEGTPTGYVRWGGDEPKPDIYGRWVRMVQAE